MPSEQSKAKARDLLTEGYMADTGEEAWALLIDYEAPELREWLVVARADIAQALDAARDAALDKAIEECNRARREGEGDVRQVRERIRALKTKKGGGDAGE